MIRLFSSNDKTFTTNGDSVKKWEKILEFTFDETEKMPSDIDVSKTHEGKASVTL